MLHCAHPNVFVEADMYSQRGTLSIDLVNKTNLGVCVCVCGIIMNIKTSRKSKGVHHDC